VEGSHVVTRQNHITIDGTIMTALGRGLFRVSFDNGRDVVAVVTGGVRENSASGFGCRVTLVTGDAVRASMSPGDLTKGIITRRLTHTYRDTAVA
jgi:translation initiation factor IF-1